MSEYQHITERPKHILEETMDERYTGRRKCSGCSKCSEIWNGSEMVAHCENNGFFTEIAKVEGEGNFHKAMEILGNERKNNNWKKVFICSEINGIQGCWAKSVKHGPPWVVVGFDTRYFKETRLTGRKVFNYAMD